MLFFNTANVFAIQAGIWTASDIAVHQSLLPEGYGWTLNKEINI